MPVNTTPHRARAAGRLLSTVASVLLLAVGASAAAAAGAAIAEEPAPGDNGVTESGANCAAGNLRYSADDGFEYRRDRVELRNVVIYECGSPLRIAAQRAEASSLDFDNSTWTLTGAVSVRMVQGQLAADNATVQFASRRLAMATVNGVPATFEQRAEKAAPAAGNTAAGSTAANSSDAQGHARTIIYNVGAGEVQFVGEAWLSNGCNEITGPSFTYNVAQKSVKSPQQAGGRVQGTIRPQCKGAGAAGGGTPPAGGTP